MFFLFLQSFWNWLNKLLKTFFEKSSDQRRPSASLTQAKDPLGFSWWISVHVASLYQIDRHGLSDEMVRFIFALLFSFCIPSVNMFL